MDITRTERERGHVRLECGRDEVSIYADGVAVAHGVMEDVDIPADLAYAFAVEILRQRGLVAVQPGQLRILAGRIREPGLDVDEVVDSVIVAGRPDPA